MYSLYILAQSSDLHSIIQLQMLAYMNTIVKEGIYTMITVPMASVLWKTLLLL